MFEAHMSSHQEPRLIGSFSLSKVKQFTLEENEELLEYELEDLRKRATEVLKENSRGA